MDEQVRNGSRPIPRPLPPELEQAVAWKNDPSLPIPLPAEKDRFRRLALYCGAGFCLASVPLLILLMLTPGQRLLSGSLNWDGAGRDDALAGNRPFVSTIPAGAVVLLDFVPVGVTPLPAPTLGTSGYYFLSISKEGYAPLDTFVYLSVADPGSFSFVLTPEITDAAMPIRSPVRREAERSSPVRTTRPEAHPPARTEEPRRDELPLQQRESEEAPPPAAVGLLTVQVWPWGSVYIDDVLHARDTDVQYRVQLPVGAHRVRVFHPTLGSAEKTVRVMAGAPQQLVIDLGRPAEASPVEEPPVPLADARPETPPAPSPQGGVYAVAEEAPVLIGGLEDLHRQARYPQQAHTFGLEGRVFLQFIVDETGRVREPEVTRGLGMGCDEEALRVIRQARFVPGKVGGRPVAVRHALFIEFRIPD